MFTQGGGYDGQRDVHTPGSDSPRRRHDVEAAKRMREWRVAGLIVTDEM